MITDYYQIERLIGMRGIDPREQIGVTYDLVNHSDGQGIQLQFWEVATLGPLPTVPELAAALTNSIALEIAPNNTDDGIVVTATLTGGSTQLVGWRCVDPTGTVHIESANASGGVETWEIITGQAGEYIIQAWAAGFGFASLIHQEV